MPSFGTRHARSDRGQNKDTFQPLAKDKNPNVQKCHGGAGVRPQRIQGTVCGDTLPDKYCNHGKRSQDDTEAQSCLHFGSNFITCPSGCCWLIAFF
jgi:hypothetical protein